MIIPMLCVTIFVILVVWFLLPRVARLMIHTRSEERFSRNAETDLVCRLLLEKKNAPDTRNEVSTQEWQGTFRAEFNNGDYTDDDIADVFTQLITTPFHIYKNMFIPNGIYHFARHQLTY